MQTAPVPALALAILSLCLSGASRVALSQPGPPSPRLGFGNTFGAAAAALADEGEGFVWNPATLAMPTRHTFWSAAGLFDNGESWWLGAASPPRNGVAFGLAYTRTRLGTPQPGYGVWRNRVHLGTAWSGSSPFSVGANVQLLTHENDDILDTSFGLDLGARWTSAPRGRRRPAVQVGVTLHNALEPRLRLGNDTTHESRTLSAGVAWRAWRRGATAITWGAGIEAQRDARRAFSTLARADVARLSFAVGLHDARFRGGARISRNAWSIGYSVADAREATRHGLDVVLRFGTDVHAERIAEERARELELASRLVAWTEQRDASQRLRQRKIAEEALALGHFERAAAWYRVLLEAFPGDAQATQGLVLARHGALMREADSLLQANDRAGAARALERAVALAPNDSASAERLQELQLAVRDASRTRSEISKHFTAGIDAYARGDHLEAVRAFDSVLAHDPKHASALSYREQAMNAHNMRVRSALKQARMRLDAGDYDEARAHVRRALDLEPARKETRRLSARIERAAMAAQREAEREAQEVQLAARQEDAAPAVPTAEVRARYDTGMQLYRSGDLMRAMQTWEEVARMAPHFEEVDKYLLRVYRVTGLESYTEGRLREAVDIWEKALRLEPDNTQLRRYLTRAHAKLARAQSVDPGR